MTAVLRTTFSELSSKTVAFHTFLRCCSRSLNHIHDHYYAHFVDNPDYKTVVKSDSILKTKLLDTHSLEVNAASLSDSELSEAILLCRSSSVFKQQWKDLDKECCKRMSRLNFDMSVRIMDSWVRGLGSKAFHGNYFTCAVAYWVLHQRFAKREEFVHLTYLLGQKKSVPENLTNFLHTNLKKFLPSLSPKELAIVCNSLFKLGCKIVDHTVLDKVAAEVEKLMVRHKDSFDLLSLLKFLRMCQYYDETLLANLTTYILECCDKPNVTECAHYLAVYSTANVYVKDVFEKLETHAFSSLKSFIKRGITVDSKAHPADAPRIKDIAKILWAFANVGHKVSDFNSMVAVRFIGDNFHQDALSHILDALQSLACLGVYPEHLTQKACSSISESDLIRHPKKKLFQQYVFVKNSALIMLSSQRPPPLLASHAIDADIGDRPSLANFIDMYSSDGLRPSYILPHIRIAGVAMVVSSPSSFMPVSCLEDLLSTSRKTVTVSDDILRRLVGQSGSDRGTGDRGKFSTSSGHFPVSIEVLDDDVTLRNSSVSLLGIMKAKVEQLTTLGVKVVFVTPCCVESLLKLDRKLRQDWLKAVVKDCVKPSPTELCYGSESVRQ